jgi:polyphosphate kinase
MERAGVQICYSFPDLKVHAKVGLVRRETDTGEEWHAFLSTGNFNEKTARIYADHGFFSSDAQITTELREVFRHLFDREYQPAPFQKLLVAQFNMRTAFEGLIQQEMANAQAGKPAKMLIKLNNLEDPNMIECLYAASQAGVHIQMIIRGICCLRPQVPGLSENIWVTRVVDQFLEHARVFVFHQLGADRLYLASADWMSRNLNRRIEVGFPILHPDLRAEVLAILELQLADTVKAVRIDADMENCPIPRQSPAIRCQAEIYRRLKEGKLVAGNLSSKYS